MNWYIESSRTEDNYLKNVRMTVEPCMNYICAKMFEVSKLYENQNLDRLESDERSYNLSYFAKICPIETPEGESAGLNSFYSSHSRALPDGSLLTP